MEIVKVRRNVVLVDAFLPSMIGGKGVDLRFEPIDVGTARAYLDRGFESAVGYQTTADFLTEVLRLPVPCKPRGDFLAELLSLPAKTQYPEVLIDGDTVLVLCHLRVRIPVGKALTAKRMAGVQYQFILVYAIC